MKLMSKYLQICLTSILLPLSVPAAVTVNFDDLAPRPLGSWVYVPQVYAGLQWYGFGVLDGSLQSADSPYRIGIVSPNNVVFNLSGREVAIVCPTGFTLRSAHFTKPTYLPRMHLRVQGLVGTNVTYDNTYTLRDSGPTLITFNYIGVDRVLFVAPNENFFAMDDLVVTVPSPEESCTYVVSQRNPTHGLGRETGVVTVSTQADCEWSVFNTNNWITILSPSRNAGSGTVSYIVNATTRARTGVIKIAGQSITVTQARPTKRQTLTFDDLPIPGLIPHGYGGMQWGFGVLDGTMIFNSGLPRAVISPHNLAVNLVNPAFFRSISGASFNFHSAYITYIAPLGIIPSYDATLQVQGFTNGALVYDTSHTFTTNPNEPRLIHFNYFGVTEVRFTTSLGFPMDNVTISTDDDDDADDDGVPDDQDRCPDTPAGDVVNQHGCSIDQLVPCSGPARGGTWRNHAEYVGAVIKVTESFRRAGLITARERTAIIQAAVQSDCGKPAQERLRRAVRRR
jgi:hypothetical protein